MIDGAGQPGGGGAMRLPGLQQGFLAPEPRHPLTGSLGVQAQVRGVDGSEALLDDHVGPGFALLWNGPPAPLSEKARSALARLGARQVSILAAGSAVGNLPGGADVVVEDFEGSYERWFHTNEAAAVLVRPDFAVYGATTEAKEMSAMLEALVYRLVSD
jgi:3-(3-hydroxy-phenyl)propionate hydroxylase/flavoprotein hydroxylase